MKRLVLVGGGHAHLSVLQALARENLQPMPRSGVHAVHAGPVLAANLLAALKGGAMTTYKPRRRSLYLLARGPRYAVASWGSFGAEGERVWRWKDWIDRRFIDRFSDQERRHDAVTAKEIS